MGISLLPPCDFEASCTLVQQAEATIPDTPDDGEQPRVSELHGYPISCEMLSCATFLTHSLQYFFKIWKRYTCVHRICIMSIYIITLVGHGRRSCESVCCRPG